MLRQQKEKALINIFLNSEIVNQSTDKILCMMENMLST